MTRLLVLVSVATTTAFYVVKIGLFVLLNLFGFVSENAYLFWNFLAVFEKLVLKQNNFVF